MQMISGFLTSSDGNNPTRFGSFYDDYLLDELTVGQDLQINWVSGSLTSSDGNNPTRFGSFYDDYLLDDLSVGQDIQINLDGSFDTYLQLVNAATREVIADNDDGGSGLNSELNFTVEDDINYLVRATSYGSGATGDYSLTTTQGDLEAVADRVSGSWDRVSGSLTSSDGNNPTRPGSFYDDYLLDDLSVGQDLQINLDGSFDTYLQLVNAATREVIADNDDGGSGLNSELNFTVEDDINYLVRATSYDSGATGDYSLTTTGGSFEDQMIVIEPWWPECCVIECSFPDFTDSVII